jgi:hypothetical protein
MRAPCHLERVFAAACEEEAIVMTLERLAQDIQIRRIIVDQQDAVGFVSGGRRRRIVHGIL